MREEPSGRVRGGLGLGLVFSVRMYVFSVRFKITDRIIIFFLCVYIFFLCVFKEPTE